MPKIVEHITKQRFPQQVECFEAIQAEKLKTFLDKNADYSPANILYTGEIGLLTRLWDKFARLFSLYGLEFPSNTQAIKELEEAISLLDIDQDSEVFWKLQGVKSKLENATGFNMKLFGQKIPKNESIDDTLKDASVYLDIFYIFRQGKWGR